MTNWDPMYQYLVYEIVVIVLIVITAAAVACRVYVRVYLRGFLFSIRSWHWSDILLVLSWAGYCTCGVMKGIVRLRWGWIPQTIDEHITEPNWLVAKKLLFHYVTIFWVFIFVVKGAMLCFFDEFISKREQFRSWLVIRFVGVLVFVGGVSCFVYQLLWCLPLDRQWATGDRNCWPDNDARLRFTLYRQSWHVILDLIILFIPVPMLPLLKNLGTKQQIGLAIMLILGLFCCVSAITFTIGVMNWDKGPAMQTPQAMWFLNYEPIVELPAAIILQCIPAIRYVLFVKRRPTSMVKRSVKEIGNSTGSTGVMSSQAETLTEFSPVVTRTARFPSDCEAGPSLWYKGVKEDLVTIRARNGPTSPEEEKSEAEMFSIGRV